MKALLLEIKFFKAHSSKILIHLKGGPRHSVPPFVNLPLPFFLSSLGTPGQDELGGRKIYFLIEIKFLKSIATNKSIFRNTSLAQERISNFFQSAATHVCTEDAIGTRSNLSINRVLKCKRRQSFLQTFDNSK